MLVLLIVVAAVSHAMVELWAARRALHALPPEGAERMATGIRRILRRQLARAGLALAACAVPWPGIPVEPLVVPLLAAVILTVRELPLSSAGLGPAPKDLAERVGVPLRVRAGKQWNARAEGLGPFRRITLTEGLLSGLPADEAAAVIAHEAGHLAGRHRELYLLWRLGWIVLALGGARLITGTPLTLAELGPLVAALPVLALPVRPLQNRLIRRWEEQADRHAAARAGAETYARALSRLFRANGQGPTPPALWAALHHPHPPPEERLRRLSPS